VQSVSGDGLLLRVHFDNIVTMDELAVSCHAPATKEQIESIPLCTLANVVIN
jgi:hypothetical protein